MIAISQSSVHDDVAPVIRPNNNNPFAFFTKTVRVFTIAMNSTSSLSGADQSTGNSTTTTTSDCASPPAELFGPEHRLIIGLAYMTIALLSFFGNLFVLIVTWRGHRTTLVMRKFLANLAIADLLTGVFHVPFSYTENVWGQWIWPAFLCPTVQFVSYLSVFVTAWTLVIISVDRYLAIAYHKSTLQLMIERRCHQFLAATWILGILYTIFGVESTTVVEVPRNGSHSALECRQYVSRDPTVDVVYTTINFVTTFAVPLIILTVTYTALAKTLIRSQLKLQLKNHTDTQVFRGSKLIHHQISTKTLAAKKEQAELNRIVKMLLVLVVSFAICMMPIKTKQLIQTLDPTLMTPCTETGYYIESLIHFFCHWLAMAHCFANPIIYSFMSSSFRNDFIEIIKKISGGRRMPLK